MSNQLDIPCQTTKKPVFLQAACAGAAAAGGGKPKSRGVVGGKERKNLPR
jgi:hypothetical protein